LYNLFKNEQEFRIQCSGDDPKNKQINEITIYLKNPKYFASKEKLNNVHYFKA